jgi:hypothetical protein
MYGHPIQSQARRVAAKEGDPVAPEEEEDPVAPKEGQIQVPVATTEEEGQ